MADLGAMRLPSITATAIIDPPAPCPVCGVDVSKAEATVTIRTTPGERHGDTIDVHVHVTTATLTALPCGHVIHERREDDDD